MYVGQREVAILSSNQTNGLKYLGSEDATTCHIIILSNVQTEKTALAHLGRAMHWFVLGNLANISTGA